MADAAGVRPTPAELLVRAEAWRPWRAYAAQHLWAADAVPAVKAVEPPAVKAVEPKRSRTDARQRAA